MEAKNNNRDFGEYVKKHDFILLLETWVEGKELGKWCKSLPKGLKWEKANAQRVCNNGRASRWIVFDVRINGSIRDGVFMTNYNTIRFRGKYGETTWHIVAVYNVCGWEKLCEELGEFVTARYKPTPLLHFLPPRNDESANGR